VHSIIAAKPLSETDSGFDE